MDFYELTIYHAFLKKDYIDYELCMEKRCFVFFLKMLKATEFEKHVFWTVHKLMVSSLDGMMMSSLCSFLISQNSGFINKRGSTSLMCVFTNKHIFNKHVLSSYQVPGSMLYV